NADVSHVDVRSLVMPILASLTLFTFSHLFSVHTPTNEIYTLSLHDALPISPRFGGMKTYNWEGVNPDGYFLDKLEPIPSGLTPSQLYVFMPPKIRRAVQQECRD